MGVEQLFTYRAVSPANALAGAQLIDARAYIVRRLLATIPVMVIVGVFVFLLLHLSPGDPAAIIAGDNATAEHIAAIRQRLGLDEPLRAVPRGWATLRGDLGTSMFSNMPVLMLIGQRAEPTSSLALTTLIVAVTFAVTLRRARRVEGGTLVDRA